MIGAGKVAERKVRRLLECAARVVVVAPSPTEYIKKLSEKKKIIFKKRCAGLKDLKGVYMVIMATTDREINALASSYCRKKNILINVVDSPEECSFILPSIVRRGNLTIAISTDGASPALSKKIRQDMEKKFGVEYTELLRIAAKLRPKALKEIKNPISRKALFERIIQPDILKLLKRKRFLQAREKVAIIFGKHYSAGKR